MENNMVIENEETVEENPIYDQDEFNEAMNEFCRLAWSCSQFTTDAEKLAFVQSHKLSLTDVILKAAEQELTDEIDKQDTTVIIEEGLIMIARILNRISEKNRTEFKEIFLDEKD